MRWASKAIAVWFFATAVVPEVIWHTPFAPVDIKTAYGQCVGQDLMIHAVIVKAAYPGGRAAQLLQLQGYSTDDPPRQILRIPVNPEDSRAPGTQEIKLVARGGCSDGFTLFTMHKIPLSPYKLARYWGPYQVQ